MIALDTNVVVRFLVRDDEKQAQAVYARLEQAEAERERLFVPLAVVLETIWVLGSAYNFSRQEILDSLEDLTRMAVLEFEAGPVVQDVLAEGRRCSADLSDLLIAHSAKANGCDAGLTFDRRAAKLSFFRLLH